MGFWNFKFSIIGSLKRMVDAVKKLCKSSYDYICGAVSEIDHAVKVKAEKLNQYSPDKETVSQIATNLAKNAAVLITQKGLKKVPGGAQLLHIVLKSFCDVNKCEGRQGPKKEFKDLKLKVDRLEEEDRLKELRIGRLEEVVNACWKKHEQVAQNTPHFDSNVYQEPEDDDQNLHDVGIHRYPSPTGPIEVTSGYAPHIVIPVNSNPQIHPVPG